MRGEKQKRDDTNWRGQVTEQLKPNKKQMEPTDEENGDLLASRDGAESNDKLLRELSAISNDIRDFKKDIHSAISDLKGYLKKDLKDELATLRHELNQKLPEVCTRLQSHDQAITEAEERISDMETSGAATKEALLKEQRRLQVKVTDLESRSRRNNIRVYGVPEYSEGNSMIKFMENC